MKIGAESVTVQRASLVVDPRHNRKVRNWSSPSTHTVGGCSVQPYRSTESTMNREFVSTHWRLFAPFSADIEAADRVVHDGITYEVDGEPAKWRDLRGVASHIEASLKRLTG